MRVFLVLISRAIEYCKAVTVKTTPAEGEEEFNGVVLEIDITTGKTKSIKRVNLRPDKNEGIKDPNAWSFFLSN